MKHPLLLPLVAAFALLAGATGASPGTDPAGAPPVDDKRKVRLLAPPAELPMPAPAPAPAPADSLATVVSVLLGMGVAVVLVWRLSRPRPRRRRHGRIGRRSRVARPLEPGDNPFDDDQPIR